MRNQLLNEQIEFVNKTHPDELVRHHLKKVFDVYYKLFGEVCTGCPTKVAGYINRIKKLSKSNIMDKSKANYRLKKGAIIPIPGTSQAYSNENLTDEIALAYIQKNPNRKVLFAKLPDNIDALLKGTADQAEATHVKVGDRNYSVEEGVSILGQIGVTTSAKTIDGVQKRFDGLKAADRKKLDGLFEVAGNIDPETKADQAEATAEQLDVNNPETLGDID